MKNFTDIQQHIKKIILSDKFKYELIIYTMTFIHTFLIILFSILWIIPLIIFNIISVILYMRCLGIIKYGYRKELIRVFYLTYFEIIVHSFVTTICIGWQFGFPQYIIGLIPFGYYMCHILIDGKRKYIIPTLLGLIAFFSFIGCRTISMFTGFLYDLELPAIAELAIYIFNATCNFAFLFIVTLIYVIDMQLATNQLRMQNVDLDNMASVDPLTGLYNRRSMQDFFDDAIRSDRKFCLIMCDIDNFKKVNDTYGHDFGDVVLKEISEIIIHQVQDYGYVCRWGGEELLILCNDKLDTACRIAENIRRNVEEHIFHCRGKSIHCSLTLGVAAHKKGSSIEDTITHADSRLYYGKQNGKNRVVSPYDTA